MINKFHLYCSCVKCHSQIIVQNIQSHYSSKHISKSNCGNCNTPLYTNNKFCSKSCAAIINNSKKDWSKIKTGPKPKSIKTKKVYKKLSICEICFASHVKNAKTCSLQCKSILLSNVMKERIYNGFNPNTNRGRGKRSFLEQSFENWLKINFPDINYKTEQSFKRLDKTKTYFVDFYFPNLNLIIELDGSQHKNSKEYDHDRDNYISSVYNVEIIRITHQEYTKKSKLKFIIDKLSIKN